MTFTTDFRCPEELAWEQEQAQRKKLRMKTGEDIFNNMMNDPSIQGLSPIKISWEEGKVFIKRGTKTLKTIIEFEFISTKLPYKQRGNHTGTYEWEKAINDYFPVKNQWDLHFQKHRLTYYRKVLGGNAKTYVRELQACMFKAFIPEDMKKIAQAYCRESHSKRIWIRDYVQVLNKVAPIIRQAIKDGQENIIPFIIAGGGSVAGVSELRKQLGKSVWKTILKNSATRNFLICENLRRGYSEDDCVEDLLCVPTSILKNRDINLGPYPRFSC